MFPITNIHVKDNYETTIEFFALRTPHPPAQGATTSDRANTDDSASRGRILTPVQIRSDKLTRGRASRRRKTDAGQSAERRTGSNGACSPQPRPDPPPSTVAAVRSELEATRNELARSQADATKLAERYRMLERTLKETTDALRAREKEVETLREEKEQLMADHRSRALPDDLRIPMAMVATMTPTSIPGVPIPAADQSRQPPVQRSALAMTREEDIAPVKGLEVFLTKTDSWSGAQVIEAVQDLNSEILQLAAAATELSTVDRQIKVPRSRIVQATKETASGLGQKFAQILSARDHSHDLNLIQFGMQACITMYTARLLSVFCIGLPAMPNDLLTQVFQRMHATEPQATSSRWRSLTLQHIRALYPRLQENAINDFVDNIVRGCIDIFTLCYCTNTDIPLTSKDALKARFGSQIRHIAHAACKVAHITKEETMSTNFEIVLAEQSKPFDQTTMINAFAGYDVAGGSVLATTELGLRCSTRKTAKLSSFGPVGEIVERKTLLQPKVILETVAQLLDHSASDTDV
ncbi:hypothetical protein EVG20_g4287 [Dentipellis fragilis]|uniref:Uncharacterized protein n=1 Tax=Dentipellis fragilis TaxID=205917 RepID=A0A4Y9YX35_9AGAM|nr:hypothetical protein EVG20_g4287 [Dentipellis fragilis]